MKSILSFFSPTEVVLIDDDIAFLESAELYLASLNIMHIFFNKPKKAINYIEQNDKISLPKSLEKIPLQLYLPDRFKQISTIIVDYDMPNMNGLEVCRQITSPYIQKIMLTGAASHELAVDAFNEGVIHQFIKKDDPDAFTKLEASIAKAQERYFDLKSHDFANQLYTEHPETEVLKDPVFVKFFEKIIQEKQVTEYYLLDAMGSFLFISDSGKPSSIFVFNEEALEFQEDMIPENDRRTELAQEIYSKKQAICFYPFNIQEKYEPANWKSYLQPLNHMESGSPVFYAFVSDLINLDQNKIVSFKDFRSK